MAGPKSGARETWRERRAAKRAERAARPDNRLALPDEALLAEHHAAGMNVIIQVSWLYEHDIDVDALRRFHHHLGQGLLGRRIERPAVSVARHRWVVDRGQTELDIADTVRPRADLSDWIDERSQVFVNPESGPCWHIGVQPLDDGSTAISLVLSHNLIDGLGLALVIIEAALGKTRDLGYPPPMSRTKWRARGQDARATARDLPKVAKALGTSIKLGRQQAREKKAETAPAPPLPVVAQNGPDEIVLVPAITAYVNLDDWDACAQARGGASHTLAAAFSAKLGERAGRRRADTGAVTLQIPISDRTEDDTRAMALSYARVTVDPAPLTTDLTDIRAAVKKTLKDLKEKPDVAKELLWLPSFAPERTLKKMVERMPADPEQSVFCSYLGDLHSIIGCPAGSAAEYENARGTGQRESRQLLDRLGGRMMILSGRINGKIFLSIGAYQPGAENTKQALREMTTQTLSDFGLTAVAIH